ncbi:polysaccharide deacetylase family protein [Paenibacillus yonginensis]|uniref:polysaccharide deacetylase family protein n=1 Tax=Paenibacillus yonginensis TaxID=1462996 RepID=UPI0008392B47|nr:polysaccharide deacetylase family protein [Paenibacillus yonginensis]
MRRKSGIIAAVAILVLFAILGGAVTQQRTILKNDVRLMLVKLKLMPNTGQSPELPIKHKPSDVPTPNAVYYRDGVIVLMYHEVTKTQTDPKALLASKFKEQLELMKANGFHWITMGQYRDFILHHAPVPDNAVLMTFDDGYESFYQDAYPLLQQYQVPATNFVIVNTIDNPKHPGIPKLNWKQIQEMHRHGVDFFNHTYDSHSYAYADAKHREIRALLAGPVYQGKADKESTAQFESRIYKDLLKAQVKLHEEVGNTYDVVAFPYGVFFGKYDQDLQEPGH